MADLNALLYINIEGMSEYLNEQARILWVASDRGLYSFDQ